MPNARLYRPGAAGTPGIAIQDQGTALGQITTLNVEGVNLAALIFGSTGIIQSPPVRFGYFSGGFDGGTLYSDTDGLDFTNDTAAMVVKGALNTAVGNAAGCNSALAGYVGGGFDTLGSTFTSPSSLVQKLLFSTDTAAMTLVAALTLARSQLSAANSSTRGYFSGGQNGPVGLPGTYQTLTDSIDFTNDGAALVVKGSLTVGRSKLASCNSATAGYFAGGAGVQGGGDPFFATTDGLVFASDTTAMTAKGVLTIGRGFHAACNSSIRGYFSGGTATNGGAAQNSTDGLVFATDTVAMVAKGVLTVARSNLTGCNSRTFGYFAGNGAFANTCDGLDFSNDVAAMVAKGVLVTGRAAMASFQSSGIA